MPPVARRNLPKMGVARQRVGRDAVPGDLVHVPFARGVGESHDIGYEGIEEPTTRRIRMTGLPPFRTAAMYCITTGRNISAISPTIRRS